GGGGAKAYLKQTLTVAPGSEYTITIGAGGTGGSSSYSGGNGAPGICIIEW
ncbi:glycine-rich domain-containing protein, partial [Macellibacteroides fermentans]|uniref:glycine-rich domain-containing protein n=1 Tax=Macellibacteroides fermentans TaxID=879969 RepID=UPI00406C85BB